MATTALLRGPSTKLHVRGTWSARDDRTASAVWLGVLWVGIIAGFGVDFPRYLRENPSAPLVVHLHGAVFSIWMLLLTAQVILVLRDRIGWHRKLGWIMVGWACLMAVMGPWAAMASHIVNLHGPSSDPPFISVQFVDIAGFLILLAWGIALRKNPAAHRRMMILATVSFADPGYARFSEWLIPTKPASVLPWFFYTFYGNVLLIVLMTIWEWWRGRLMRSFVIGAAATLVGEFVASVLYFWGPWKTVTLSWIVACARHFS